VTLLEQMPYAGLLAVAPELCLLHSSLGLQAGDPSRVRPHRACCGYRTAVFKVEPAKGGAAVAALSSQLLDAASFRGVPAAADAPRAQLRHGGYSLRAGRGLSTQLDISMRWYNASDGADGAIASGAYIFRWATELRSCQD
jgi:hypothetical protein